MMTSTALSLAPTSGEFYADIGLAVSLILLLFLAPPSIAQSIDRSHRWDGTKLSYGSPDLQMEMDNRLSNFDPDHYGHCRLGVLMDSRLRVPTLLGSRAELCFTPLAVPEGQSLPVSRFLFIATDKKLGKIRMNNRIQFPDLEDPFWNLSEGCLQYKEPFVNPLADDCIYLYRYLSFPLYLSTALDAQANPDLAIAQDTEKAVILIHGWNPDSNSNSYEGVEFSELYTNLSAQFTDRVGDSGSPSSGWDLGRYRWERDADTGPSVYFEDGEKVPHPNSGIYGTRASEIARQHGVHLGQLIEKTCPDLKKLHIIAHSAGSWGARSCLRYLNNNRPALRLQLTLLDPFMPNEIRLPNAATIVPDIPFIKSSLGELAMSQIISDPSGRLSDFADEAQLHLLENYYAEDLALGTQEEFDWRAGDINRRLDDGLNDDESFYDAHSGPIRYYADTIRLVDPDSYTVSEVAAAQGRMDAEENADNIQPFMRELNRQGWPASMFWHDLVVIPRGEATTHATYGGTAAMGFDVTTQGRLRGDILPVNAKWAWFLNGEKIYGSENREYLEFENVGTQHAGDYSVQVTGLGQNGSPTSSHVITTLEVSPPPLEIRSVSPRYLYPPDSPEPVEFTLYGTRFSADMTVEILRRAVGGAIIPVEVPASDVVLSPGGSLTVTIPSDLINPGEDYWFALTDTEGSATPRTPRETSLVQYRYGKEYISAVTLEVPDSDAAAYISNQRTLHFTAGEEVRIAFDRVPAFVSDDPIGGQLSVFLLAEAGFGEGIPVAANWDAATERLIFTSSETGRFEVFYIEDSAGELNLINLDLFVTDYDDPCDTVINSNCDGLSTDGGDTPETHIVEMGANSGTFTFQWEAFSKPDQFILLYEGGELFDTGCVGDDINQGKGARMLTFSGISSKITVQVKPNCNGISSTRWEFTVVCPE